MILACFVFYNVHFQPQKLDTPAKLICIGYFGWLPHGKRQMWEILECSPRRIIYSPLIHFAAGRFIPNTLRHEYDLVQHNLYVFEYIQPVSIFISRMLVAIGQKSQTNGSQTPQLCFSLYASAEEALHRSVEEAQKEKERNLLLLLRYLLCITI